LNLTSYMNDSPKILLIDNQPPILAGLTHLIIHSIPNAVIMSAKSLETAISILKQHTFDLVITEILGGIQDGTGIISRINSLGSKAKILVYSSLDEEVFAPSFLKAGAMGFLSKRSKWNETVTAIQMVLDGQKYMSAELRTKLILGSRPRRQRFALETERSLSMQEMTVMELLLQGKSTREIACTLKLKDNTISTFKRRIFKKLNVTSALQLYFLTNSQFHLP
jgi:DNA-binding NarL/FixJ family response regulator